MVAAANLVEVAALVGDTARATMLNALMGGQSLTATELAYCANVSRSTASGHLSKLVVPEAYQSKTIRHGPNCSRKTIANVPARMRCNASSRFRLISNEAARVQSIQSLWLAKPFMYRDCLRSIPRPARKPEQ